jgi:hypothetical protein
MSDRQGIELIIVHQCHWLAARSSELDKNYRRKVGVVPEQSIIHWIAPDNQPQHGYYKRKTEKTLVKWLFD